MTTETLEEIAELRNAIQNISHGGLSGPLGLEAVTMALGGQGTPGENSVFSGLNNIASAINDLAEAIREHKGVQP